MQRPLMSILTKKITCLSLDPIFSRPPPPIPSTISDSDDKPSCPDCFLFNFADQRSQENEGQKGVVSKKNMIICIVRLVWKVQNTIPYRTVLHSLTEFLCKQVVQVQFIKNAITVFFWILIHSSKKKAEPTMLAILNFMWVIFYPQNCLASPSHRSGTV